ncbi:Sgf11 (Transcriptional regulation protein) protein [Quillaja saponaria]|uniref:Sgf11 (Transcriptional regulation protein) protein n=1 Tax=Quillaja saponaria TaxID=32244 RepID=A0AAD7LBF8_QUISA|nr:Sgf11 (Transcriptional regulation protein) protein [Quillaja saponaria]
MVCSFGSGRMAVMTRLQAAGSFSQTISEDIGHQKSAAEYICRELREADEANLLDEQDMHVFGLKPMTDRLELVCCNNCKKPVKSSQYSTHAELCRSLKFAEETVLELHGGLGNRKPPRKEKKKLLTSHSNQAPSVVEQERSEALNMTSESHSCIQAKTAFFSNEAKASLRDGSGVNHRSRDRPASLMPPPTKRSKLIAGELLILSDKTEKLSSLTKTTSFPDGFLCRDVPDGAVLGRENPKDCMVDHKTRGRGHEEQLIKKDFPVPLATKIYYSQRNHRLRSALSHMYFQGSSKEDCTHVGSPKLLNESAMSFQVSSQRNFSVEQMDDMLNKKRQPQTLSSVQGPNQNLAKSSEICMSKADGHLPRPIQNLAKSSEICMSKEGGHISSNNFSNQFPVDNVLRSAAAPLGLIRSNYLPKPYSFAGNSGKPLGTIQQPKGSVHVR